MSTFLSDPNAQCEPVPTDVWGERLLENLGRPLDYPILELDGLSDAERRGAREAWQAELDTVLLNHRLDLELQMATYFCGDEDYIEALRAQHVADRPRRAASLKVSEFFWAFVTLPVAALALGLFLFWSPFRQRT